jgi:hypothetical protein
MKLPNCTKKRETRATLYTFKIMSIIKREMRLKNNRLSKIGDHISTNRRIKLRENRRNIKLFTNKHKEMPNPQLFKLQKYLKPQLSHLLSFLYKGPATQQDMYRIQQLK